MMLDIIDKHTKEPNRQNFYYYYVGNLCSLNHDLSKCVGKSVAIHRLSGGLEGSTTIITSIVEKVASNECESKWQLITENTIYTLGEYRR